MLAESARGRSGRRDNWKRSILERVINFKLSSMARVGPGLELNQLGSNPGTKVGSFGGMALP